MDRSSGFPFGFSVAGGGERRSTGHTIVKPRFRRFAKGDFFLVPRRPEEQGSAAAPRTGDGEPRCPERATPRGAPAPRAWVLHRPRGSPLREGAWQVHDDQDH
ncbi:hypothetical protein KKF84_15260 [Myxococcota bacterium]|nr:hypothetical protein [Myxococcota bacterium]